MRKHILNDAKSLDQELVKIANAAYQKAEQKISQVFGKVPPVDVIFAEAPGWTIPNLGFGGRTFSKHFLLISLDPEEKINQDDLKYTICHEINHIIRVQALGDRSFFYGATLIDGIIGEGLAELFEVEVGRANATTFNRKITTEQLHTSLKEALAIGTDDYDYDEWFFGENSKRQHWLGYNLGIYVIDQYCKTHNAKPSQITCMKTSKFAEFIKKKILI